MEWGRKSERKIEKSQEYQEEAAGWQRRQRGWLNPGLFARSKWRSAVILKFSRWQGARIGLKNQSGSLFLMITASRPESGNCCCFLPIPPLPATSAPSLSLCFLHPRTPRPPPVLRLYPCLTELDFSSLCCSSLLHLSSFLPSPRRACDSPNLSLAQPLPPVSLPPPTIAIAIVNRFKYDGCIYDEPVGI